MSLLTAYVCPHPPIIVPSIGGQDVAKIKKTLDAYKQIAKEIEELKPDTIIISTPHNVMYQDYFHVSPGKEASGSFAAFGHPELTYHVRYDEDLRERIIIHANKEHLPVGTKGEQTPNLDHGVLVPLSFLKEDYPIVRLSLSGESLLTHARYGQTIARAIEESEKRVVFIASGDLSHVLKKDGPYGFQKEGPIFDEQLTNILHQGAFDKLLMIDETLIHQAKECGLRSMVIMAGVLDEKKIDARLLSYEGPFGVGYAVAKYNVLNKKENFSYVDKYLEHLKKTQNNKQTSEDEYVKLARTSIEHYMKHNRYLELPSNLPDELIKDQRAVFVTIKKDGQLRGCIGTVSPTKDCVAKEIIYNAVSAALRDPRFKEITPNELPELTYSVDVLSPPEDIDDVSMLDPSIYGVIVYNHQKSGLLLPQLEGITTVKEQLNIAKQKANIKDHERYNLKRFKVTRHH